MVYLEKGLYFWDTEELAQNTLNNTVLQKVCLPFRKVSQTHHLAKSEGPETVIQGVESWKTAQYAFAKSRVEPN